MGLDYTFQIAVPRWEASSTLQDIASLCYRTPDCQDFVFIDNQRIDIRHGNGRQLIDAVPIKIEAWLFLPQDGILLVDSPVIPEGHGAISAEIEITLNDAENVASFEIAANTTNDSLRLETSKSFRDAMHDIARRHHAYHCVLDREDDGLVVTWFESESVEEELPIVYWIPPRETVAQMVRANRIERALAQEAEKFSWEAALSGAIADLDPEVRTVAARLLGEQTKHRPSGPESLEISTAGDLLITAAHDVNTTVRNSAIEALGRINSAKAIPVIEAALDDPETRNAALQAICEIKGPESDAAIVKALARLNWHAIDEYLHYAKIIAAAGERKLTDTAPILCARANSETETGEMQVVIVRALGLIGDPRGIKPAIRLMEEGKGMAPCYAIWALHDIGDASALPDLERMLSHKGTGIREAARQAIAAIKERELQRPNLAQGSLAAGLQNNASPGNPADCRHGTSK